MGVLHDLPSVIFTVQDQHKTLSELVERLNLLPRDIKAVSEDFQVAPQDRMILVNASLGPVRITVPASRLYYGTLDIKKVDESENAVIVEAAEGELVEGAA